VLSMLAARRLFVILAGATLGANSLPGQQGLTAREDTRVDLPLTIRSWVVAVARVASSGRRPVGLEFLPENVPPAGSPSRNQLVLTGLDLESALALLIQNDSRYVSDSSGEVINVRPKISVNMREDFLNGRIAEFIVRDRPLVDVLDDVHRALDPSYPSMKRTLHGLGEIDKTNPERARLIRSGLNKPISVALRNATVRALLNRIALTHGGILWQVTYRRRFGAYDDSAISFIGFDNWTVSRDAKPRSLTRRGR
jgi:hypothetical protein